MVINEEVKLPSIVCDPKFVVCEVVVYLLEETIHSELEAFVPLDASQSVLGLFTEDFLIRILSLVPLLTPATSHPDPGSEPLVPTASSNVKLVPLPPFHANPMASSPLKEINPS